MFKIGDKVKIVGYTQVPKHLYDLYWNPDMEKYVGVTSTISEICVGGRYKLKGNHYTWSEVWIAPNDNVEEELLLL